MPDSHSARVRRRDQVREYKRAIIRAAAQEVFAEHGIGGASMRQIAQVAGWTTGALYQYFESKEELYAEVLRHSLDELFAHLEAAREAASSELAIATLSALWGYYNNHSDEFDLGFYLYKGARPRGLTPQLNAELNDRLDAAVRLIADALVEDKLSTRDDAHRLATAHTSAIFGLVLVTKTGRLASLGPGHDPDEILTSYFEPLRTIRSTKKPTARKKAQR